MRLVAVDRKRLASAECNRNLLAIVLANKLARIAWAVFARDRDCEPRSTPNAASHPLAQFT